MNSISYTYDYTAREIAAIENLIKCRFQTRNRVREIALTCTLGKGEFKPLTDYQCNELEILNRQNGIYSESIKALDPSNIISPWLKQGRCRELVKDKWTQRYEVNDDGSVTVQSTKDAR